MSKISLAVATALALVAAPAVAAESGFYVGVGAGDFSINVDNDAVDDAIDGKTDDGNTGVRLFGGWQFNQYFGVEGGWDGGAGWDKTIGDITSDGIEADLDIDIQGFDLMLVATLPMGDTFYGFAKAGVLFWDVEADLTIREDDGEGNITTTTESGDDSGEDPAFGLGFGFKLGEQARVQAEYTDYHFNSDVDGDFISASFIWAFK